MSQLVIDDSPTIRTILEVCLRRAGYDVRSFEDGVAALRWLASPDTAIPELVLVDLGLPKLDGYEVIKSLNTRPNLKRTVIVILSKRDGILDRVKGRLIGAQAYITKPFRTQTLLALVEAHLGVAGETTDHAPSSQLSGLAHTTAGSSQPTQKGAGR